MLKNDSFLRLRLPKKLCEDITEKATNMGMNISNYIRILIMKDLEDVSIKEKEIKNG